MVTRFADAVYWIALLNAKDSLHHRAVSLSRSPDHTVVVTTEMVLTEVLNAFAARGDRLREAAAELVLHLKGDENVRVVPQTSLQLTQACSYIEHGETKPGARPTVCRSRSWKGRG